jgi:O-antigen ligase
MGSLARTFHQRPSGLAFGFSALAVGAGLALGLLVNQVEPLYVMAIVFGLFVLVATIASVEAGLLVLIFLTYTRFSDIVVHYHGAPSVAKGFIFLLILAIGLRWAIFSEQPRGWLKPTILLGIYGLVGFASLISAAQPDRVQESLLDYIKDSIIAVMLVVLIQRASMLRRVIWALLAAGIFMGTLSVFQYLTGNFLNNYGGFAQAEWMNVVGGTDGYRLSGPVGDPNFYAQVMVVLVPLALERVLSERRTILRFLAGWAGLVCAATVIFTLSRGGFLALVVILVALTLIKPHRLYMIPVMVTLGILLVSFLPPKYLDSIFTLQDIFSSSPSGLRSDDYSLRGRASENLAAWSMFRDRPLLGVGWRNYSYHYIDYAQEIGLAPSVTERAAHNLYLEVAAETGLFGLGSFGLIILVMARSLLKARKDFQQAGMKDMTSMVNAFAIGLLGYMVASIFVHAAYPRYFWLLAGIVMALPQLSAETIKSRSTKLRSLAGQSE